MLLFLFFFSIISIWHLFLWFHCQRRNKWLLDIVDNVFCFTNHSKHCGFCYTFSLTSNNGINMQLSIILSFGNFWQRWIVLKYEKKNKWETNGFLSIFKRIGTKWTKNKVKEIDKKVNNSCGRADNSPNEEKRPLISDAPNENGDYPHEAQRK